MGFREWGFYIESNEDIENVCAIISLHNRHVKADLLEAEELDVYAVIRHKSLSTGKPMYYLCAGSSGGGEATSDFIADNYNGGVYFPHCKPSWWKECQDYVWRGDEKDDVPSFETFAQ